MLDSRGKQLKAGDLVAVSTGKGIVYGRLEYDPDDIRYKRLRVVVDGKVRYYDKLSRRILDISSLVQDELDRPIVSVLH